MATKNKEPSLAERVAYRAGMLQAQRGVSINKNPYTGAAKQWFIYGHRDFKKPLTKNPTPKRKKKTAKKAKTKRSVIKKTLTKMKKRAVSMLKMNPKGYHVFAKANGKVYYWTGDSFDTRFNVAKMIPLLNIAKATARKFASKYPSRTFGVCHGSV